MTCFCGPPHLRRLLRLGGKQSLPVTRDDVQYTAAKGVPLPEVAVFGTGVLLVVGGLSILSGSCPASGSLVSRCSLIGVTR
jgi:hypothetical protein